MSCTDFRHHFALSAAFLIALLYAGALAMAYDGGCSATYDSYVANCVANGNVSVPPITPIIDSYPNYYITPSISYQANNVPCGTMTCYFPTDLQSSKYIPSLECATHAMGSIIKVDNLVIGETIPIVGTPWNLVYFSDRVLGRQADYKIHVPMTDATLDANVTNVTATVTIAGQTINHTVSAATNLSWDFYWNSLDGSSNLVTSASAQVSVAQAYSVTTSDIPIVSNFVIGAFKAQILGLGDWGLTPIHFYDFTRGIIYFGDGSTRDVTAQTVTGIGYQSASADGSEIYNFDLTGRHTSTQNGLTGATLLTINYDTQGRLTSVVDAYGNTTTITRDLLGNPTGIQAPYGQTTSFTLDANGLIATVTNPNSEVYQMTYYSAAGLLYTFQKPTGAVSTMTYDGDGNLTLDSNSAGNSLSFVQTITGPLSATIQQTSNLGRVTNHSITWDSFFHQETRYSSEPQGRTTSMTDGPGSSFQVSPSDGNSYYINAFTNDVRLGSQAPVPSSQSLYVTGITGSTSTSIAQTLTPTSPTTIFSFTTLDTQVTTNTKITDYLYTASTGKTTITSPVGRKSYVVKDALGKTTSSWFASFTPFNYTYDTHGRLSQIAQNTRTTSLAYNTSGFLSSITDALSQVTSFTYDAAGRVASLTLPDTRVISYTYDSNGNIASVTPPGSGGAHGFLSNLFDLVSSYLPPSLGGTAAQTNTVYTYNNDKQLTQVQRPDGVAITYNYDLTTSLLTSITYPTSASYFFAYDTSGRLSTSASNDLITTALTYDGTFIASAGNTNSSAQSLGSIAYTYNNDLRVTNTTVAGGTGSNSSIGFAYDNDGLMTTAGNETLTRNSTTGLLSGTTLDKIKDVPTYNSTYAELSGYTANYNPSGTTLNPIFSEAYTRDALGRLSTRSETIGGTPTNAYAYTYDSAGRLTAVTKNSSAYGSYSYDANSNRTSGSQAGTSVTATYDAQDRLSTYNTKTYSYNLNGERTSVYDSATLATTSYTYDALGNLKTVTLPSSTVTYTLDGLMRRISKKVGSTVKAYWVYEGSRLVAELNSSRAITKRFIYSSKSNVPDYAVISGTRYRIISDSIGSVRFVVKSSDGTTAQRIDYDEFGRVLSDTSPGFQPFGYAGGMYDQDTGLTLFGARNYDPSVGRWLSKDPILFNGGDTNLFGYVANDPVNLIDPSGHFGIAGASYGFIAGLVGGYISSHGSLYGTAAGGLAGAAVGFLNPFAASAAGAFAGGIAASLAGQVTGNFLTDQPLGNINLGAAAFAGLGAGIGAGVVGALPIPIGAAAAIEGGITGGAEGFGGTCDQTRNYGPLFSSGK
jgi:RHS repeat-associated protein